MPEWICDGTVASGSGGIRPTAFFSAPPPADSHPTIAVIVFAWYRDGFVLADIPERGWCTPGGRIEPGESPSDAARREAREETGAILASLRQIGYYVAEVDTGERAYIPVFVGPVAELARIPKGSESRGARIVAPADVPACYYQWDELFARAFALAEHELRRNP